MSSLLRRSLLVNGVFSVVSGLVAVVFNAGLAEYMSISPTLLYVIGGGVLLFGLSVVASVLLRPTSLSFARFVIVADLMWVLGGLTVLAIPSSMSNKWVLAAVSVVVGVIAVLQLRGLADSAPRRLTTEIEVAASPTEVWSELTDFASFQSWNPFMVEATGEPLVGSRLRVRMMPPGGSAMTFTPTVTSTAAGEHFEWVGHLFVPGLFDGRHRFELEEITGGTRLRHSEEFTGLLVPLLWNSLDTRTREGFEAMNRALRDRVEGSVRDSA